MYKWHGEITSEPAQAPSSHPVNPMAACTTTGSNLLGTMDDLSWLATSTTVSANSSACNCYHGQASNLITLNSLRSPAPIVEESFIDSYLQCVTAVFLSCQRTLRCQLCRKDSSVILFTVASVQIAYIQLESLLVQQANSQYSSGSSSQGLESRLLSLAEAVLDDLQQVVRASNISSITAKAQSFWMPGHHLRNTNRSSVCYCLQPAIDRLQDKLAAVNNMVSLGSA
jgi:hypothetical protein